MVYRIMDLEFKVNMRINNSNDLGNINNGLFQVLKDSFVTYIYYNLAEKKVYVGETKQFIVRHNQHMAETSFLNANFDECVVIYNASDFSGSHVKDLEYLLINHMFAELDITKFKMLNGNKGQVQPQDFFEPVDFIKIWEEDLFKRKLVITNDLDKIRNKILFKYSPFKKLSDIQSQHEEEILSNPEQLYLVDGGAGTGKTVLLMSLVYRLVTEQPNKKIAIVTTGNLTEKFNRVLKALKLHNKVKFERAGKVISEGRKEKYDVVLVDEAHRLQHYYPKGHPAGKKHFDKTSPLNELEMLQQVTEGLVVFYDPFQTVRPQDIKRNEYLIQTATFKRLALKQQFRIKDNPNFSGDDFIKGILYALGITKDIDFNPEVFDKKSAYFSIADSISELFVYGEDMDCTFSNSTNRVIAGYTKGWKSNSKSTKNKGIKYDDLPYDWVEGNNKWRWNKEHTKWVEVETSKKEIGSIHAIQGADIDYVGVIIGNDLMVRNDELMGKKENYKDTGGTPIIKDFCEIEFTDYISNIYYILLTRGISGCKVYFEDENVKKHFLQKITHGTNKLVNI